MNQSPHNTHPIIFFPFLEIDFATNAFRVVTLISTKRCSFETARCRCVSTARCLVATKLAKNAYARLCGPASVTQRPQAPLRHAITGAMLFSRFCCFSMIAFKLRPVLSLLTVSDASVFYSNGIGHSCHHGARARHNRRQWSSIEAGAYSTALAIALGYGNSNRQSK